MSAGRWDIDDISGHEALVFGFVAFEQEVIKIEFSSDLGAALQLDVAHGPLRQRAAGCEHGIE